MCRSASTSAMCRAWAAATLLGCVGGFIWMAVGERHFGVTSTITFDLQSAFWWIGVTVLAATTGLTEDVTHSMKPRWRLAGTILAALLAFAAFGIAVLRIGIPAVDQFWTAWPWLGVALALLVVAGLPHAINIIDGYNGLAGILAMICCLAIAYVALR